MEKTIQIKCKGAGLVDIDQLIPIQNNLKDLSEENYAKLRDDILELGYSEPVSVWNDAGKFKLLNGTQRHRTLSYMRKEGYVIPQIPVNWVEADNEKQAKKKILALTSQFGEMTSDGLYEFLMEAQLEPKDIDNFRFPEIDLDTFKEHFLEDNPASSEGEEIDNIYSTKVESPIYQPKGERPPISDLFDRTKTEALLSEIEQQQVPNEVKEFLMHAAQRHTIFNYENIAEYYSHATKEVQELMEKSALVIIDFKKAIENGFVNLTKDLSEIYPDE